MAINYPGSPPGSGIDTFTVPSNPEGTPLGEAGTGTRDLVQSVQDIGAATTALEQNAALLTHDHSGNGTSVATGAKLSQVNTHQSPDTDSATTALHHTLGTGANQAAPGNHVHTYAQIQNTPYIICTSLTHPSSPFPGMTIFETDTNFARIYTTIGATTGWFLATLLSVPNCRLIQETPQSLGSGNNIMSWDTVLEDNNTFFNSGSPTNITVREPGLYHIDCAVQWNTNDTVLRENRFQRGETFDPGFSQTLSCSGKWRFAANDVLRTNVTFTASEGLLGLITTFFEHLTGQATYSNITSRIELCWLGA